MEAVKNSLTRVRRNPRSFVINSDSDVVANACDHDFDETPRGREAHGVVDDRVDRAGEPIWLAHDYRAFLPWSCKGDSGGALFPASFPTLRELLNDRAEIDALKGRTGELGIGSRCFADVANKPVQARHVFADDRLELLS